MVAIVAGNGLGLLNTSLNILSGSGVLGQSVLGQGSSRAFVNAVNGNLVLQSLDAQLAGRGKDLYALRTYNSLGTPTDGDEDGWRWGYEQTVRFQGPGAPLQPGPGATVVRIDGDGHETTYTWDAARTAYVGTEGSGAHDELKYDGAAAEWVWTDGSTRVTERYSDSTASNMTGRLVRCTDTSNNSIALAYDGGRLTRIQDTASQQELRLTYGLVNGLTRLQRLETRALIDDASGRATAMLGDPLRLVEYDYDGQGRLTTVTGHLTPSGGTAPAGASFITSYSYDDSSTRIASVTQSDGTSLSFTYDAVGRVSAVKDHGGAPGAQLAFAYGNQPNSTAIADGDGQVWTYRHDGMTGQLTEVRTPPVGGTALSTKFLYDVGGNLVSVTDPQNNAVTYGYDNSGNRALERDAIGNMTTRTFSALNQVLTETRYRVADPDGAGPQGPGGPATTRYVYDANSRLRFAVSAEGRVTETRYGSPNAGYGLLTQTLLYVGQLYDVTGLGPTQQLTKTELTDWVAGLADKTQVQLTEYSYDLRGNMSQQTSYATVGAGGAGVLDGQASVTEYVYDAHSRLRQRTAVRGSTRDHRPVVASFAYDGMTRVLESTGANGAQTTVYDDANRRITVTAASGLTETRDYDSRGRLVSVSQTGNSTTRQTRYVYDNADRPRMVEDAQGGRRYRFYDAAGRLEFKVDATGAVTRFEHNPAGQLVRQTQYVNRADTGSWYDSATQTITKAGLTVGGAGSDVTVDAAHDRVTTFDYDEAGRLTASTDAVNTVTTVSYDGLSRVIMTQAGDRVTRYLYDKDNRRVGVVDALGYFAEYKYDAGGRLVETVRYSQRSPAAATMTAPVWIGVTQQTVVSGRPFEYRVPAYDADGDPLTLSVVGAAPGWLSFDAGTATLRGTPPATATSDSITLRADDGRGKTSDVTVLFIVRTVAPDAGGQDGGPPWVPLSPLDIVANTPVSHVVPAAGGQSLTYGVLGGLPPGLSFDATTLTITGSSSAVGFYSILLRATDASGKSTDRTVSVRIRAAATTPAQPAGSDQPSAWRPADTSALHSYLYYDGQGRVVGAVDEQQFLTETVYDDALNTQRTLRYLTPVTVAASDTLDSLKSRAGGSRQVSLVQYDDFGRVREVTGLDGSTVTRNEYDEAGRLTRMVTAANTSEQRGRRTFYNAFGEVTATLGGEGDAWLGTNPPPQRLDEAIREYGIRYAYDTLGRMVRSIDANGNRTLFYYDRENRRTHTVNIIGQSADNSLAGEVNETTYNSFGEPESVRRYAARLADADMDQLLAAGGGLADQSLMGKLAVLADASLDQLILYEYDRCGRLVKQVDGENGVTENIYNAYGELAAQVRSTRDGQTTTKQFDYDLNGRVVSQTDDVGGINANTRTDYDAFGRAIRSTNGAGRVSTTAYQDSGRRIVVTDPLQRTTRTEYDALGRVSRLINALGQQTVYAYDETARSVTATTPEGKQVTTARTRHGETLSVTDARGNVTRYAYNRDGQPTSVMDALGRVTTYTAYDKSGRRLAVTDARGTVTRFGYDQRNRVVEQRIDPAELNLTTLFEFDAFGQQIRLTEGAGTAAARVTTYGYDRKGRTKTVVLDAAAGGLKLCTTYAYDGLDNAVTVARGTVSSPNQHVMLYEFDSLGRRVKEIAAPASVFGVGAPGTRDITTQYRYDAAGRLTRRIDANGQSTWHVYDAAGQLTHIVSALGEVSQSRYDLAGRLVYSHRYLDRLDAATVAAFGDVVVVFAAPTATPNDRRSHVVYDGDGRARFSLKATGASGWVVGENRYDANGNLIEVRGYDRFLPDGRVAALDSAASPGISVAEMREELRTTLGYRDEDPGTLIDVQRTFFAYDASNRRRFTVDSSGSIIETVCDAAGNVIATVRFAVRPTLVEHTEAGIDAAVDRDDPDNRVTRYAHDAANRLRYTVDTLDSVSENEYDARGNVVKTVRWATRPTLTQHTESAIAAALAGMPAAENDQVTRFVHDAGNRLRFTIDAAGSVSENAYDALGNVVMTRRFARRPAAPASFTEGAVSAAVAPLRNDLENQVTRFAYDAEKRLRFAVDTLGSVTESVYDANGNLLLTTRFAARPTLVQYDEGPIAAAVAPLRADPTNRTSRFAYDAQNRLRFSIDALGSLSERVYDALGNVTSIVRFAVRPPLAQYAESAIDAAVAPERGNPDNRLEHRVHDALGRLRFSLLTLSVEAGQPLYQVTGQELNALGQTVTSASYANALALGAVSESAIAAAIGGGDASRDRVARFVYDRGGRELYKLQAVTVEAGKRKYRVSAQRFDAFGQLVGKTDFATTVALDAFDKASIATAVQAIADEGLDRFAAMAYDALGQAIFSVRALRPGSYQVVRQEYDALGRVVRTTQHAKAVDPLANFDRETIEAAANAVAGANDRKVHHVHDAAGRQRFVLETDRTGHWTIGEGRYDAFGNLAESRRYDRFVSDAWVASVDATRPAGAREQDVIGQLASLGYNDSAPASLANIQCSRFAYDTQNRLRFTIDALGSVAENVYDAFGNLTTTVRYATRPAPAQYIERAIDAAVDRNDGANRVEHFAHDALGQLRFHVHVIEPNAGLTGKHRISERRYDALGQLVESRVYARTLGHLGAYDETTLAASVVADAVNDRRSAVAYDAGGRQAYVVRELRIGPADRYVLTKQVHDALGQLVQRVEYASPVALTQLDASSVESAVVPDSLNDRTTTYIRDAAGRMRFEIRADLSFRETEYDALDQVMETRHFDLTLPTNAPRTEAEMVALRGNRAVGDGMTRGQVHAYDAAGRLARTVDALGNVERYEYNALGSRTEWIDKNGSRWTCRYDRKGRKTRETAPPMKFKLRGEALHSPAPDRALETRFRYDAFGNLIRKIEAANFANDAAATDFLFDNLGRPTGTLFPGYYDAASGSVEPVPSPERFRQEASITYDPLGNIVRTGSRSTASAFDYTYRTYDPCGQMVHEVNALNHVTRYTCNALGERETVTRHSVTISGAPQNGVYWTAAEIDPRLNFGLDELGHVMEDVYARTIRFAYDKLGRKSAVTLPRARFYSTQMPGDASQANYFRLSPASVLGIEDAAVTRYEYNAFGEPTLQRVRANTIVEWQDTAFAYDVMGRRTRSVDAAGNVTATSYDLAGNLVRHEEPTGQPDGTDRITEFAYNVLDQQTRIDRYGLRYTEANGAEHGVAHWTWENGGEWLDPDADVATTVRTAAYDGYGKPLTVTDAAGNITSMRYNALGRVIEVTGPARLIAPLGANGDSAVDPFRNQLSETLVTSMTLDAFGRPVRQVRATSQGADAREIVQSYDFAGNLVSTTDPEGNVKRRSCDPAGRVVKETQAIHADLGPLGINEQGLERRYAYDALGQLTDTLDVYFDGSDRVQSGKSVLYNAFGEVAEERRKWGPAIDSPATLNTAKVAWYYYDNAGHVIHKAAGDGLTLYYYNLLGQVTREEKRGNSGAAKRVTEIQYDVLGRATMIRRPAFEADITPGTGTTLRLVTPYLSRTLDRWGNVRGTQEGGYHFVNGQLSNAPAFPIFRSYVYDDNNRVVREGLGTHGYVSSSGLSRNALISKAVFRDLLGNVVKEIDEARDPQSEILISSRTRRKQYDSVGHVTAEIDATDRQVEYAYSIHGERLGTRNARGTVFFDRYDRNGNVRFHGVLRLGRSPIGPFGEYDSRAGVPIHSPHHTLARIYLNAHLYDQANRRFASRTFMEIADAPWSYTWLDGRNLGIQQRDAMGVVTQCRFDPFGNKAVEIDGAGARSEWNAATADYAVGRIETYRQPTDNAIKFGQYTHNDLGEVKAHILGNTRTDYEHHANGLVSQVTIMPDVTQPSVRETTRYEYDGRGQLTMEGRFDADSIQTKMVSYDTQGRLSRVEQSKALSGATCDVRYMYDEWSNVRRVQASYSHMGLDGPYARDSWYDYDRAGRMTICDGTLSDDGEIVLKAGMPGSVRIAYDNVGRRSGITQFVRQNTTSRVIWRNWDTRRDERYEYDDLGHLRRIEQRVRQVNIVRLDQGEPENQRDQVGSWQLLSSRVTNRRGDIVRDEHWTRISGVPNSLPVDPARLLGTTMATYRADGQVSWTKTVAVDPKQSTETEYTYSAQTGQLDSYVFRAFRSDGVPFTATFEYRYVLQYGRRVVSRISDIHLGLHTRKTYDPLGRLSYEIIDLQRPNGPGSDRYEERFYRYAPERRIIFKDARLRLSASGPGTVPLPMPTDGQQTYIYAGDRLAATVGTLRLSGATKFDFAYTPMSEAARSGSSRYVVQSGESLVDIAQASYGDGALWYVIADANGVASEPGDPLPSSEVGKAYEVPSIVRSSHTASTFTPFGMAEIIGNDRPIAIPPPPPRKYSDIELMAIAAASTTVQVVVTVGLSAWGVPVPISAAIGSSLGNLAGQGTSWGLGMQAPGQDGIDWSGVGMAAMEGYMFSVAGPAGPAAREIWQQAQSGFAGWTERSGPDLDWGGLGASLFNIGIGALGMSGTVGPYSINVGGLIASAYNPRWGWALQGSGRSPAVEMFGYLYGTVANGLVNQGFARICQRLNQPSAPRPRSVDDRQPIDPDTIDRWDAIDREQVEREDREALAAINERIAAASKERMAWLAQLGVMEDRIAHFGEGIDDRALIRSALRQIEAERELDAQIARLRRIERESLRRLRQINTKIAETKATLAGYDAVEAKALANLSEAIAARDKKYAEYGAAWGDLAVKNVAARLAIGHYKHAEAAAIEAAEKGRTGARILGGFKALQAGGEYLLATGLAAVGAEPLAIVVGLHASDTLLAASTQIWTGEDTRTLTAQGASAGASALGFNDTAAYWMGEGVDFSFSFIGMKTPAVPFRPPPEIAPLPSSAIRIADDVTLFKGVPPEARAARAAGYTPALLVAPPAPSGAALRPLLQAPSAPRALYAGALLDAPSALRPAYAGALLDAPSAPRTLALGGHLRPPGGVPSLTGRDHYTPGVRSQIAYEETATRRFDDRLYSGDFEPRSRHVANITDGSGGFGGGKSAIIHASRDADEVSFKGLIDVDEFSNDAAIIDRLSRARQFDVGGYFSLTGKGGIGRPFDMLDADEALQNLYVRYHRGVERHSELLKDNPAIALTRELHSQIENLRTDGIQGLSAQDVLRYHLDQMRAFTPDYVLTILERESLRYIEKHGL